MNNTGMAALVSLPLLLAGCQHYETAKAARPEITVDASVTIAENGAGGYSFAYDSPFSDEEGNFDFSKGEAFDHTVVVTFSIADGSAMGVKFKQDAREAIWIGEQRIVGPAASPKGPYEGSQFYDFSVSDDGLRLAVTDRNNDAVLYRYALRFDRGSETVVDDPDWGNGGCQTNC